MPSAHIAHLVAVVAGTRSQSELEFFTDRSLLSYSQKHGMIRMESKATCGPLASGTGAGVLHY